MNIFSVFRYSEWTMKRKLFGYMLFLATLLLLAVMIGLFLLGQLGSTKKSTYDALNLQMDFFEKEVSSHFDNLAAAGISLSEDMVFLLETYLAQQNISFHDLTDSDTDIANIQDAMIDPLRQKLLQENCSGIFVMLDTTVNSELADAAYSKTGLYLQSNGYVTATDTILLYRGLAEIGKRHHTMPHRKWQLEFQTDRFPDYSTIVSRPFLPLEQSYYFTDLFTLPGTSEQAVLLTVPMFSSEGFFYGICGFEISKSYFSSFHVQPTKITHLTCLLSRSSESVLYAEKGLSCGAANGYYRVPNGELFIQKTRGKLLCFSGDTIPYIGIMHSICLSPNNAPLSLTVMMPKSDYDHQLSSNILKNILLWLLLLFFTIICCLYFSRRFLSPILKDLSQLKSDRQHNPKSQLPEINDLFAFLAEQDRKYEESLQTLLEEKETFQNELTQLQCKWEQTQNKYKTAKAEISHLSYFQRQEVDPEDYKQFLSGIHTLTPTERKIFDYYLAGKNVKEIIAIASIKESTLRYHNQNIYSKLGVHSLKQLLLYAAHMEQTS